MNELIWLMCLAAALGSIGGFLLCMELTRWADRKRARELAAIRPQPPIVKAAVKLGKALEQAFLYGAKTDNPPHGEKG